MIDYRTIGYIALGLFVGYIALRVVGLFAFRKLVRAEVEHVLNSDEHKVKGRYHE